MNQQTKDTLVIDKETRDEKAKIRIIKLQLSN